ERFFIPYLRQNNPTQKVQLYLKHLKLYHFYQASASRIVAKVIASSSAYVDIKRKIKISKEKRKIKTSDMYEQTENEPTLSMHKFVQRENKKRLHRTVSTTTTSNKNNK